MVGKAQKPAKKTTKKSISKAKPVAKAAEVTKKSKIITIAICIVIPLGLGFLSSFISGNMTEGYGSFTQPPFAPPAWLFPVAWSILYILMGIASYFIFILRPKTKKEQKYRTAALITYCLQLAINFAWSPVFFGAGQYFLALVMLIVMWLLLLATMFLIRERSMPAMWCFLPYALWCLFAMYLNIGVFLLN